MQEVRGDLRGDLLMQRVVDIWNVWPEVMVKAEPLLTFKKHLDKYLDHCGIEDYGPNMWKWDFCR